MISPSQAGGDADLALSAPLAVAGASDTVTVVCREMEPTRAAQARSYTEASSVC